MALRHATARRGAARRYGAVRRHGFTFAPGMTVGLYGGSFNPVHQGHAHVARTALARLGLDRVLWLVTPRNPLKTAGETAALDGRLAAVRRWARGPAMIVSDIERVIGTRYTIDTVRWFRRRFPGVHFVWIMGADGLAGFHRWRGWADLVREVPIVVISRPGPGLRDASRRWRGDLPPPAARRARPRPLRGRRPRPGPTCRLRFITCPRPPCAASPPKPSDPAHVSCYGPARTTLMQEHPLTLEIAPGAPSDPLSPLDSVAAEGRTPLEQLILGQLDDDKAYDIVFIDLKDKSAFADSLIIASGRSHRHVGAIADHLLRAMKDAGHGKARVEGLPACDWVLIDAGDLVVHLFRPEVRNYYNIEKIWSVDSAHRTQAN